MLFDQHWDSLDQASFLKLQYIPLFLLILSLAVINLMVETRIWKRLLGKSNDTGEIEIFKAVIVSYTLKSVSTQYIGAFLGKQHLFGLKKWKYNVFSHITFGGLQSLATTAISGVIILIIVDLNHFMFLTGTDYFPKIIGISALVIVIALSAFVLRKQKLRLHPFKVPFILTLLRAGIYFIQFGILILYFFEAKDILIAISVIAVYFMLKTFVPVFSVFGGIGLREYALLGLFSYFGLETMHIPVIGLMVWLANFIFPVLSGAFVLSKYPSWSFRTISSH
jgi:hypothetical protein